MDYGTFLEKATDGILISYKTYGSYTGDYVAIIEKDHNWLIYKGSYGSCSGCDWLESTKLYSDKDYERLEDADYGDEAEKLEDTFKLKPEAIKEYFDENQVFLLIPKSQLPETLEDFKALLPANTRTMQDEDYDDVDQDAAVFEQMKNFEMDNLVYLEKKHKREEAKNG